MAGPILARLIPDVTDAVMDAHGQGPDLVRGLMGTVALAHHDLLPPTGEEAGRGQKGLTGLGHDLAPLGHTGAAALADESYLHASYHHMNWRVRVPQAPSALKGKGASGKRSM